MYGPIKEYLWANSGEYGAAVLEHLKISMLSVLVAILIAVPLGVLGYRSKKIHMVLTEFFSLFRIVPSMAILFICIPIMGTGVLPAAVALTVLAIPPILINTVLSFRSIQPSVSETAVGMGMGAFQRFVKVEVPLAVPLVLTGIRTAATEVIASATLAAYIGAGGLGKIIFTGLGLYRMDLLLIGGLSVAILSLSADAVFFLLQRVATRYQRA